MICPIANISNLIKTLLFILVFILVDNTCREKEGFGEHLNIRYNVFMKQTVCSALDKIIVKYVQTIIWRRYVQ